MDYVFSQQDLSFLDDVIPEKDKKKKEDEKKKKKHNAEDSDADDVSAPRSLHRTKSRGRCKVGNFGIQNGRLALSFQVWILATFYFFLTLFRLASSSRLALSFPTRGPFGRETSFRHLKRMLGQKALFLRIWIGTRGFGQSMATGRNALPSLSSSRTSIFYRASSRSPSGQKWPPRLSR